MKLQHHSVWKWTLGLVLLAACVEPRDTREGRVSEAVYLKKADMLDAPKGRDSQWLMQTTVVRTSTPNVLGDYAFPGFTSDLKLVDFRFSEDALQVIAGQSLQADDRANPNDDHSSYADRVMLEFPGEHVDVRYLETLNGETTNRIEENRERAWDQRSDFRVDFEDVTLDPITTSAWFYGEFLADCAKPVSTNLVPGSYEFDEKDQHLSFEIEVNYAVTVDGGCYDLVTLATGAGTTTIHYRMSFLRRDTKQREAFESQVIKEKDEVNKKYGAFQLLSIYRDPESGLLDAHALLQRWNPQRPSDDPVVFYFHPGFPERFKPMFQEIEAQTNQVMEQAGATLRFAFREWNDGGIERHFGDIRYSFVVWHQDIDSTRGLLGYGPSAADPRTGELLNANLNLYNVGMDYYRFLIQDFLELHGAPAPAASCKPGERAIPTEGDGMLAPTKRFSSGLFQEMRRSMEISGKTATKDPADMFIPAPIRSADRDGDGMSDFIGDYVRTLGEYRYVDPGSNQYVYRNSQLPLKNFKQRLQVEREFQDAMHAIQMNQNPFGGVNLSSKRGIEAMNEFAQNFRKWRKNHEQLEADKEMLLARHNIHVFNDLDAISAIAGGARLCKENGTWESDREYRERIIEDVVFHVAIHEFGHNLSLRHNFYGSVDAAHMQPGERSASVMDYVTSQEEVGSKRAWGGYDRAALSWIYGDEAARKQVMGEKFLYCTDEHRSRSPLCTAHDLGVTPSQIVLNAIERYDWLYDFRNRRAYRTFWDTSTYDDAAYSATFSLQRMWYLGIFDWAGGGVQDTLKRLDQLDSSRKVLSDPEYDEISRDFYTDIAASVDLVTAFYDAVINQSASTRNYQTEFDPFFGDVLRLGIINDKLYATAAFMDLQEVYNYNPNVETYVAMYDTPLDDASLALSQRVLDNMLGANYDTFPWFRYFALNLFSEATNSNLVSNLSLRDRVAIRRFENVSELEQEFGVGIRDQIVRTDNPQQVFVHDGEQYIYTYLADQGWHLVSNQSRSPVSFQFMREYNEALNSGRQGDLDNYGLKTLLAYYELYNNFVGF
ncbi:MAG TPA: zinc-dependent metalloprotease [Polyangiales bacterium]|nr:zinc-dependent metalloprotease [Polyangiales bacterium]